MLVPYLIIIALLFLAMPVYFRIADRFNIIDKPNQRSSHTKITIRGGGIVFYLGALIWFIWSGASYPWFFAGLTAITVISFLDDVFTMSNRVRITVHLVSVLLMIYELGGFGLPWYVLPIALILIIGTINAYNFMDGINGITAMYSFAVLLSLWLANRQESFIDDRLLYCTAIANGVFAFFNFRQRAKCFAGDVGSVSMCFILLFATLSLIFASSNPIYILFFAVYGVDSVLTIAHRLMKRENIFEAHRSHLYQYLANEARANRLMVSTTYGILQAVIGWGVIQIAHLDTSAQIVFSISILALLGATYIILKTYLYRRYIY
jgi:UDP-N-acetylmuramyl pentapeptide phosphotransferase/UDP-N-acetylglucosamine-1-phosphate transferase